VPPDDRPSKAYAAWERALGATPSARVSPWGRARPAAMGSRCR